MNAPPYPESVSGPPPIGNSSGAVLLHAAPALQRYPITGTAGFAIEVSTQSEPVYLLGDLHGRETPVPCRVCGTWNPAVLSGRHFFFSYEPDAVLDMTSVRRVQHHIGRLAFPSGWHASPWLSAPSRRQLMARLQEFAGAFLEQKLERRSALQRTVVAAR